MKALYRKYRPLRLDDVVGQEQVTVPLKKSLDSGKINHAYLFVGPRGCGKTSVARILAHEVNGFKYEIEDDYVDIIEIDGASNRGIDNIRDLREKVMIAPTSGKYKIYIIDEVHMLTKEAFNALLKTLEEPPKHAIFIMATTDAHKVPVTISSRSQTYTFKLADKNVVIEHLKNICEKENINIDDGALEIIAKRGGGSFRDTLSLLDQISSLSDSNITKDMVVSAMGLPEDEKIKGLLDAYNSQNISEVTNLLKELFSLGIKAETINEELILDILENPTPQTIPLLSKLPEVRSPFSEARLLVALTSFYTNTPTAPVKSQVQPKKVVPTPKADPLQPKTEPVVQPKPAPDSFDWDNYLLKVQELNDAVYSQLKNCEHEYSGGELGIFPKKHIVKSILSRENNLKILRNASDGVKITIYDVGNHPSSATKDSLVASISDIMGGEVYNDGGSNPFS